MRDTRNIPDMIMKKAGVYQDKVALSYKNEGRYRSISWKELVVLFRNCSAGLRDLGVEKGDKIATIMENGPEWAIVDLGILSIGAIHVPIYTTSSLQDIEFMVKHCEAKMIVVSGGELSERIRRVFRSGLPVERVIVVGGTETAEDGKWCPLEKVLERGAERERQEPMAYESLLESVGPEDIASYIYTSGTTGEPKGVMLTHGNFLSNVEGASRVLDVRDTDRALSFLPLSHVFERMGGYYFMLHQGVSITYAEDMASVGKNMLEARPTIMTTVPRFFEKMYANVSEGIEKLPAFRKKLFKWGLKTGKEAVPFKLGNKKMPIGLRFRYRIARSLVFKKIHEKMGGNIRFFISGGAPLAKEVAEFFFAMDVLILEGYGLTESSPVISVNLTDRYKFGTVGMVLPNVKVKIASDGEILIQGPNVMKGYYRLEEESRNVMDDGWLKTGDLGAIDSEGFLSITGRKKDVIVTSGGKNIAPQRIENLIAMDDYVVQVCVIGDKRNYLTALIVPDWAKIEAYAKELGIPEKDRERLAENERINAKIEARIEALTRHFASHEKIKYFTLIPKEFSQAEGEVTPTQKIRRNFIAEKYRLLIDRMYQGKRPNESVMV